MSGSQGLVDSTTRGARSAVVPLVSLGGDAAAAAPGESFGGGVAAVLGASSFGTGGERDCGVASRGSRARAVGVALALGGGTGSIGALIFVLARGAGETAEPGGGGNSRLLEFGRCSARPRKSRRPAAARRGEGGRSLWGDYTAQRADSLCRWGDWSKLPQPREGPGWRLPVARPAPSARVPLDRLPMCPSDNWDCAALPGSRSNPAPAAVAALPARLCLHFRTDLTPAGRQVRRSEVADAEGPVLRPRAEDRKRAPAPCAWLQC